MAKNGMAKNDLNLIWIDLEMTGLDPDTDVIIEIATIVTDSNLNVLAEGPSIVVHQPDLILDTMNEWCVNQHGKSGLTQRVRDSKISLEEAEQQTIDFVSQFVDKGKSPICGNSIGQDRRFLVREMPALEEYFHYRNLDVSSVKEIARRWKPELLAGLKKNGSHLAMDDIKDSIDELRYYREHFFNID
jgi:oligoribonuclease